MRILIIRHGEPDYNTDSLTKKGRREAQLLADRLCGMSIDDFYVSPLGRARETARPTLERLGREAVVLDWLQEFRGRAQDPETGEEAFPWDLMPQRWTKQQELFDPQRWLQNGFYSSGTIKEVYDETGEALEGLLASYGYVRCGMLFHTDQNLDKTIALFCHFGIGMTMIAHLLGLPLVPLWHGGMMPTTGVTTLFTEERVKGEVFFRCLQIGDTSHLYAGREPLSEAGMYRERYEDSDWIDRIHEV